MSINKLFAVLQCQRTTTNRLRGEARNGRRATYVGRSRRPDGDLRDKPGCVPASGCTKGAPWRISRCIGPDGSPVGGAQQRRLSPYLVSQEEKPSKSARGAGPPGTRKTRREKWCSWEVSPWMLCAVLQENARAAGDVLRYACSNAFNSS